MNHFLTLHQFGLAYRIRVGRHRAGDRETVVPLHEGVSCLRAWLTDDQARAALARFTGGELELDASHGPDERLEYALRAGHLTVARYRPPDIAAGLVNPEELASSEPAAGPSPEPTHDIQITVTDDDGVPMRSVSYELELPDGSISRGRTTDQGVIYASGLAAGQCQLSFPALDAGAWRTA